MPMPQQIEDGEEPLETKNAGEMGAHKTHASKTNASTLLMASHGVLLLQGKDPTRSSRYNELQQPPSHLRRQ